LYVATSEFRPIDVSSAMTKLILKRAFMGVNLSNPLQKSVPFFSAPGIIMEAMAGSRFPADFSMELKTSLPSSNKIKIISPVVNFSAVNYSEGTSLLIQLVLFPLNSARRRASNVFSCQAGDKWKIVRNDNINSYTCECDPNTVCAAQTSCEISPNSGNAWYIQAFEYDPCQAEDNYGDRNLRLGFGLGFGLFSLLFVGGYLARRHIRLHDKMSPDKAEADAESESQMVSYHISADLQLGHVRMFDQHTSAAILAMPDMADGRDGGGGDARVDLGVVSPVNARDRKVERGKRGGA
jgi:hypothetical protein